MHDIMQDLMMTISVHSNNNNNGYFTCYFSREHISLSLKKRYELRIRKNQQIKFIVHGVE